MASAMQSKHHARFHAAVLRHFFGPSSPPRPAAHQEPDIHAPFAENREQEEEQETYPHNDEGSSHAGHEAGKSLLSRAQRKRLKLRKAGQSIDVTTKRFVGPLLPGELDMKGCQNDGKDPIVLQQNVNTHVTHITKAEQPCNNHNDGEKAEVFGTTPKEDLPRYKAEDTMSLFPEMGNDSLVPLEEETTYFRLKSQEACSVPEKKESGSECLEVEGNNAQTMSKIKRRRLAKKRFSDSSRLPTGGFSFTAEVKGGTVVINRF
ncbi:hypothetical protein KP509_25G055100 [Ceratopteris richardii]|uniref:Uncharacterized protein n=1 Tax=Ceratopteris richardii TaxID=49495 RepID=A0A8T2RT12_CERRI|nr:hypothetical protein KP509_25G055100 [Ceratopteris richardii]